MILPRYVYKYHHLEHKIGTYLGLHNGARMQALSSCMGGQKRCIDIALTLVIIFS